MNKSRQLLDCKFIYKMCNKHGHLATVTWRSHYEFHIIRSYSLSRLRKSKKIKYYFIVRALTGGTWVRELPRPFMVSRVTRQTAISMTYKQSLQSINCCDSVVFLFLIEALYKYIILLTIPYWPHKKDLVLLCPLQ